MTQSHHRTAFSPAEDRANNTYPKSKEKKRKEEKRRKDCAVKRVEEKLMVKLSLPLDQANVEEGGERGGMDDTYHLGYCHHVRA